MKLIVTLAISCMFAMLVYATSAFYPDELSKLKRLLPQSDNSCLREGERAEYEFEDNKQRSESYVTVRVKDESGAILREFRETIMSPTHYHPIELHRCGVYFIRAFNYDPKKPEQSVSFRSELWKYDYSGKGQSVVLVNEKSPQYISYYSYDFRLNPGERLVALRDNSDLYNQKIIVKDLELRNDAVSLPLSEIALKNKQLQGDAMLLDWTRDSRYFWFSLFEAAYVNGWVRVDSRDWSYELFEAPEGVLGGYPLNIETGWVPLIPGAFWTGVVEFNEEIQEERKTMGHTADLYLYNVITKEKILVEDTDFPTWQGLKGQWLSETELEYTMPDGTIKTFTVPN